MSRLPILARPLALLRLAWIHQGFRRYFKNATWLLGGRMLTLGISFLATLFIARNLGPENYGQISYALSVVGLVGFLAPLGLDTILFRELIKEPEKRSQLLGTSFVLRMGAGILTAVVAGVLAATVAADDVSRILILILAGTFILVPFQVISFAFLARAESKYPTLISILATIVLNILKVCVMLAGEGVIYLALILLLEPALYAVMYVYLYRTRFHNRLRDWVWEPTLARRLLADSLPIMFLSAFTVIYARIDQVFIKHFIDAEAVGIYDAAVRLTDLWNFIPGAIASALFPAIVNAHRSDERVFERRMLRISWLFVAIPVGISMFVMLLAPFVVPLLYGPEFAATIPVLQVYIWSFVGTSLSILVHTYLTTKNKRLVLVLSALVPMTVNIVCNLLWIPAYGILGAAYATVLSYSLVPLFILFVRRSSTPQKGDSRLAVDLPGNPLGS
ncbi:MAG TPA: flippase [Candidatus Paceibacterota bacterium]